MVRGFYSENCWGISIMGRLIIIICCVCMFGGGFFWRRVGLRVLNETRSLSDMGADNEYCWD